MTIFQYRPDVLAQLAGHGLRPTSATRPAFVQACLNALYRYELRQLKSRLNAGAFPRSAYTARIVSLRRKYPLVSIPVSAWTLPGAPADDAPLC